MAARVVEFLQDYEGEFSGGLFYEAGSKASEDAAPYSLRVDGLLELGVVEIEQDLSGLDVKELKAMAKDLELEGYSKLKKDELIEVILAVPTKEE